MSSSAVALPADEGAGDYGWDATASVPRALEADGYEVVRWPGGFEFARVHAIDVTPDGLAGAADPGADGMALAP